MERTDEVAAAILTAARLLQVENNARTCEAYAEEYVRMFRAVQAAQAKAGTPGPKPRSGRGARASSARN